MRPWAYSFILTHGFSRVNFISEDLGGFYGKIGEYFFARPLLARFKRKKPITAAPIIIVCDRLIVLVLGTSISYPRIINYIVKLALDGVAAKIDNNL